MRFTDQKKFKTSGSNISFEVPTTLGATEYTLSVIVVDNSGSVSNFAPQLLQMLKYSAQACKSSPRSENVLLRVIAFRTDGMRTTHIDEMHGFVHASDIDVDEYPQMRPDGGTPLYQATFNAIASVVDYGKELAKNEFLVNGICYIITDGDDTEGGVEMSEIASKIEEVRRIRGFQSLTTILIGVTSPTPDGRSETDSDRQTRLHIMSLLKNFKEKSGITHFIDMGNANAATLATLGNFVSSSLIVKSKHIGTQDEKDDMTGFVNDFLEETKI